MLLDEVASKFITRLLTFKLIFHSPESSTPVKCVPSWPGRCTSSSNVASAKRAHSGGARNSWRTVSTEGGNGGEMGEFCEESWTQSLEIVVRNMLAILQEFYFIVTHFYSVKETCTMHRCWMLFFIFLWIFVQNNCVASK